MVNEKTNKKNKVIKIIGAILILIGVVMGLFYRYLGFIVIGIGLILFYYQDFLNNSWDNDE